MSNEPVVLSQLLILSPSRPISEKNDTSNHGLTGQPLNVGMKCIWDFTFYQGHVRLTGIQCRASQKATPLPHLLSLSGWRGSLRCTMMKLPRTSLLPT